MLKNYKKKRKEVKSNQKLISDIISSQEKIRMKKLIQAHEEKDTKVKADEVKEGAVPAYLLDRERTNDSKILANTIK